MTTDNPYTPLNEAEALKAQKRKEVYQNKRKMRECANALADVLQGQGWHTEDDLEWILNDAMRLIGSRVTVQGPLPF
jgi:hypothetical protein